MPISSRSTTFALMATVVLFLTTGSAGCLSSPDEDSGDTHQYSGTWTAVDGPAIEWRGGYGTDHEEHVHEGFQTPDGGYVAVGHLVEADDGPHGPTDILVLKVAADGSEEWQRRIGTAGISDVGYSIAQAPDGYVLGVGLAAEEQQQRGIVMLDWDGEVAWQRAYGGEAQGAVRSVDVLADGSIIATGYVNNSEQGFVFIADEASGFLMKVDANGDVIWDRGLNLPQGTKVREEASGTIAVLSTAWVEVGGKEVQNMVVQRFDPEGSPLEKFTIGGADRVQADDFDLMPDGGFVIAGNTDTLGSANWDCVVARLASDGSLLWMKAYGNPRGYDPAWIHDECYGTRALPGGGMVVVGGTGDEYDQYSVSGHPSGSSDEWKAYVLIIDDDGNLLVEAVYGDPGLGSNAAEYVGLTSDGGLILFNDTDSDGTPAPNNFGLMKLAPLD